MRAKKTWIKASIWATKDNLDVAQSAFLECGALGIHVDDGLLPENKRAFDHEGILATAYFDKDYQVENIVLATMNRFFSACNFLSPEIKFSVQDEEDWQGNFVKSCTTFVVEPDIYIVPSFEIEAFKLAAANKLFIEMDPENAFGTGQHQTTKLCLKHLHKILSKEPVHNGLDVGSGSGILAILMKKLKAHQVLATEVDEDALITAQKNAVKNGVEIETLFVNDHYRYKENAFDLVVANILAPVLIEMADNLSQCVKPSGHLILSGILKDQAQSVIDAFKNHNFVLIQEDSMDDWCALVLIKNEISLSAM